MEQEACQWRSSLITVMRLSETLISSQQRSCCPVQAFKPGSAARFLHSLSLDFSITLQVSVKVEQNHHGGGGAAATFLPSVSVLVPGSSLMLAQPGCQFFASCVFLFSIQP